MYLDPVGQNYTDVIHTAASDIDKLACVLNYLDTQVAAMLKDKSSSVS